jgi:hypothetical protein
MLVTVKVFNAIGIARGIFGVWKALAYLHRENPECLHRGLSPRKVLWFAADGTGEGSGCKRQNRLLHVRVQGS